MRLFRNSALRAGFSIALLLVACSEKSKEVAKLGSSSGTHPDFQLDDGVLAVSPMAAMLDLGFRGNNATHCFGLRELMPAGTGLTSTEMAIRQIVTDNQSRCDIYLAAEKETKLVIELIKKRKRVPDHPFVFSIFVPEGGVEREVRFREEQLGLFGSREACLRLEQVAREKLIPTSRCREWTDSSVSSRGDR